LSDRIVQLEQELHFSKEMVEAFAQQSGLAFVVCDLEHRVKYINQAFALLFGWTGPELYGRTLPVVSATRLAAYGQRLLDSGWEAAELDDLQLRKDGSMLPTKAAVRPIRQPDGLVGAYAVIIRDLSERRLAERKLRESEQQFKSLFENNPDGIIALDLAGQLTGANPATQKICGYSEAELRSRSLASLCVPEHLELMIQKLERTMRGRPQNFEAAIIHKNGARIELQIILVPISTDGEISGVYCIAKNITHRKQAEDLIQYMAYYDALTDLPNRRMFERQVSEQMNAADRTHTQIAVLFMDMDGFKIINDTLGHAVGDSVLKQVALRLKASIRDLDTVARMGGDEFIVCLPQIRNRDDAFPIADRILLELRKPFVIQGNEHYLSASIGMAFYPEDGVNAEDLIRRADIALYKVKEQGKNHIRYYAPSMNEEALRRQQTERELHKALEHDEFVVHYQPQIDVNTNTIIGMEALVRWQHPTRGLLYPGDFISIAEETGLIVAIGARVLETACRQCREWHDNGYAGLRVAVNLSQIQLRQDALVGTVRDVLERTQLNAASLELEITESVAMHNAELVVAKLHELVALGVQISIDDFGTGFSSLSYLSKFPIHRLKIDRSFITNITNRSESAIVASIIKLAHNLNLGVIVEGVETELQKDELPKLGCHEMQGYLFSKPVPPHMFVPMLEKGLR